MTELKPCPFCGGEAKLHGDFHLELFMKVYFVQCQKCGVRAMREEYSKYCVEDWNRRVKQ